MSDVSNNVMLTTTDNPFDPFTQWDEWFVYDMSNGYNSCGFLASVVVYSESFSDADQVLASEQAIDRVIEIDPLGIYKKVTNGKTETEKLNEK